MCADLQNGISIITGLRSRLFVMVELDILHRPSHLLSALGASLGVIPCCVPSLAPMFNKRRRNPPKMAAGSVERRTTANAFNSRIGTSGGAAK